MAGSTVTLTVVLKALSATVKIALRVTLVVSKIQKIGHNPYCLEPANAPMPLSVLQHICQPLYEKTPFTASGEEVKDAVQKHPIVDSCTIYL